MACRGTREGCDALLVILIYRISGYTIEFADMMTAVSRLLWGGSLAVREDSWGINIPAALLACKGVRVGVPSHTPRAKTHSAGYFRGMCIIPLPPLAAIACALLREPSR